MTNISERPAEIEDRAVPGHWEGNLILGKVQRFVVGTLEERKTRFVMLLALRNGRSTELVTAPLSGGIFTLPEALRRTLTWDQGKELAAHDAFTPKTGVPVYFCEPQSPWERGSNENTNGLLRQYLSKDTCLNAHTQADLDAIADEFNPRPRQTLGWKTPRRDVRSTSGCCSHHLKPPSL